MTQQAAAAAAPFIQHVLPHPRRNLARASRHILTRIHLKNSQLPEKLTRYAHQLRRQQLLQLCIRHRHGHIAIIYLRQQSFS